MEARVKVVDRGKRYLVLRWIDPETGAERQKSARTSDRNQARKLAAQLEADLQKGRYIEPSRISWEEFRERYETEYVPGLAKATAAAISTAFGHVESLLRPGRFVDLTAAALSSLHAKLREKGLRDASIACHLQHLRAAMRWAKELGLIANVPAFRMPPRHKRAKVMKGRPITREEFERMLQKTESVVGEDAAPSWKHYLMGLWWSGLRLGESLELYWDRHDKVCVDLTGRRPMLWVPAELEKGNKDRLLPMAPEFAQFLEAVPEVERTGRVFKLVRLRHKDEPLQREWVSAVVSRIGKAANVKVDHDPKTGE